MFTYISQDITPREKYAGVYKDINHHSQKE